MEELFKNSLMGQLQELGIAKGAPADIIKEEVEVNPLAIKVDADIKDSPFVDNSIKNAAKDAGENALDTGKKLKENEEYFNDAIANKRLNDLDLNILQDSAIKKAGDKFSGNSRFGKIIYKYFPKLYKGYMIKKALKKLKTLNQTANELVSKKIPYGESEQTYDALSEYLSNANTIHAKLIKKI